MQYEIRYMFKFFIFKFDLNVNMVYRKNSLQKKNRFFSGDHVKINKLHVAHP